MLALGANASVVWPYRVMNYRMFWWLLLWLSWYSIPEFRSWRSRMRFDNKSKSFITDWFESNMAN